MSLLRLRALACWLFVCAIGLTAKSAAQTPPTQRPQHLIIAVDRSGSRTPQQMKDLRELLDRMILQLGFGDALSLVEVMQGGSSGVHELRDSIPREMVPGHPTHKEVLVRDALRESFRNSAHRFTDTAGTRAIQSTDLLATIRRVSQYTTSASRRQYVIILSDMLQSTKALSFESGRTIPGASWIATQARDPMFPRLGGVCVAAVGVDDQAGRAARVRAFWMNYFHAAGATLTGENYRVSLDESRVRCE